MQTQVAGPQIVYSDGGGTVYHAMTAPLDASRFTKIRIAVELRNKTANLSIARAIRWSNDGISWDAWGNYGAPVTTEGVDVVTTWTDASTLGTNRLYMQIGVKADAPGNSHNAMGLVTLRIEFQ